MTTLDLMEAKYNKMETAKSTSERMLYHDACNAAMIVVGSEMGYVAWGKKIDFLRNAGN